MTTSRAASPASTVQGTSPTLVTVAVSTGVVPASNSTSGLVNVSCSAYGVQSTVCDVSSSASASPSSAAVPASDSSSSAEASDLVPEASSPADADPPGVPPAEV